MSSRAMSKWHHRSQCPPLASEKPGARHPGRIRWKPSPPGPSSSSPPQIWIAGPRTPPPRRDQATRMIKNHPDAVVHFDASDVRGTTISNSAASAAGTASEIAMHECTLTDGRASGRKAIHFDGTRSHLSLHAPCRSSSFTLLAWVRSDVSSRRQDLVSGSGPLIPGEIAWYLYYYNAMGFGVHIPSLNKPSRGWRNLHSETPSGDLNEWSFLTTVIDAKTKTATHFLNGKIVGMGQVSPPAVPAPGPAHDRSHHAGPQYPPAKLPLQRRH